MTSGANDRWFFEDPVARKIRLELRNDEHERRHEAAMRFAVGSSAAAATFLAGVKILDLGATVWRLTDIALISPLMSALTLL